MEKKGDTNICESCGREIMFSGQYWFHTGKIEYRHMIRPRFKEHDPIMPDRKFHERCDKIRSKLRDYEKQYRETPKFKQVLRSELFGRIEAYKDCYDILKRR